MSQLYSKWIELTSDDRALFLHLIYLIRFDSSSAEAQEIISDLRSNYSDQKLLDILRKNIEVIHQSIGLEGIDETRRAIDAIVSKIRGPHKNAKASGCSA